MDSLKTIRSDASIRTASSNRSYKSTMSGNRHLCISLEGYHRLQYYKATKYICHDLTEEFSQENTSLKTSVRSSLFLNHASLRRQAAVGTLPTHKQAAQQHPENLHIATRKLHQASTSTIRAQLTTTKHIPVHVHGSPAGLSKHNTQNPLLTPPHPAILDLSAHIHDNLQSLSWVMHTRTV